MTPFIQAQSVHAHYGASHVLQGVSLDIGRGESIGLLGRNGMGKSTFIRTILGHVAASSGDISIRGKNCTKAEPYQVARLGIAYVPEGRGIFPNLSVRENLQVAARPGFDGRKEWTYERILHTFPRLSERLDHGGQQLSGGEQQMLAIGRALMTNPDVLILDEATEGLAPLIIAEIWRIIAEVRRTGMSTLIVDRNYRKVLAHTDRCVVLEKGCLVVSERSEILAAQPEVLMRYLGV
ncbi:ABC transporter ATP-binding protein [Candidimonas sp. SYP-B2681]|uniref:ABC transporter ATP-binding protein n=1 Tax=Candidimonas sp. SYP-B2681 TaxID=2497686 RepID=UPI000F891AE1|nr:ABC transporter ATP-binding protein [Candidimonas sp. SYP-B2681]RTZ40737.1 ABC transporter ATP-binding protein [Candidimonas sp. SYP-B2681]